MGGHIDTSLMTYGTIKDHVRAGKMRFVAVINDRRDRDSDLINVPTVVELGFPETATLKVYSGFFVHKDTPGEIKKTLIDGFKKIYEDPEFKKAFEALGDEPVYGGPEFVKDAIEKTEEVSVPILKELGLYVAR
jgi:tripartite-type tricarboxylate transporter receptor subunit TctC